MIGITQSNARDIGKRSLLRVQLTGQWLQRAHSLTADVGMLVTINESFWKTEAKY
jgi:hypothetical protein